MRLCREYALHSVVNLIVNLVVSLAVHACDRSADPLAVPVRRGRLARDDESLLAHLLRVASTLKRRARDVAVPHGVGLSPDSGRDQRRDALHDSRRCTRLRLNVRILLKLFADLR